MLAYTIAHHIVGPAGVAACLAADLEERHALGLSVIVAGRPAGFLSTLRKQWLHLIRRAQRERSSTADPAKIRQWTKKIAGMEALCFGATSHKQHEADVWIMSRESLATMPPDCTTVYLVALLSDDELRRILERVTNPVMIVTFKVNDGGTPESNLQTRQLRLPIEPQD